MGMVPPPVQHWFWGSWESKWKGAEAVEMPTWAGTGTSCCILVIKASLKPVQEGETDSAPWWENLQSHIAKDKIQEGVRDGSHACTLSSRATLVKKPQCSVKHILGNFSVILVFEAEDPTQGIARARQGLYH